ncbi:MULTISPECIES: tRNA lysidine(34) synthetase TilS [Microbacterium]|uniref:tRNA lysidine(34) synthetase TilS n=1 Tax=Microbacterium TaxID=33882 RepID=UPI001E29B02C|nr:tRNA lysidine(34) synthetase TilS [Microbacterium nymphoidis]MCD2498593.1 tRNA lysidine(34) synthetase TilS [Microbacterium nymphoidis]
MPSLNPAVAEIRRAVRTALEPYRGTVVVVALSGGADSLALTAAVAFEAPKLDVRAQAITIDHGLQDGSAEIAARAAAQARALGVAAEVVTVNVDRTHPDGPEAAARAARYDALERAADDAGAGPILLAHTLDDQAETVLLGLARGSGAASLQGMAPVAGRRVRPLLDVRRETVREACVAQELEPWDDPHNLDPRYTRVRVRTTVLPLLEAELGPGVAQALARTAEQLREDNEAFAEMIEETIEDIVEHAEAGIAVSVPALAANPAALRHRIIRHVVASEFGVSLTRTQTLEIARLVTDWRGQGPLDLPSCTASRHGNLLTFTAR